MSAVATESRGSEGGAAEDYYAVLGVVSGSAYEHSVALAEAKKYKLCFPFFQTSNNCCVFSDAGCNTPADQESVLQLHESVPSRSQREPVAEPGLEQSPGQKLRAKKN